MSTCFYCHGSNLHSVGVAPDLRESSIPLAIAGFRTVLKDGVLMKNGMPRFDKLSDDEIQQLYLYIRRGAREALGKREASRDSSAGTQ
jgi:quinohemoprotein ethanol dehydrogenase